MWTLWCVLAAAAEAPEDVAEGTETPSPLAPPVAELPLQVWDEDRWTQRDLHGSRVAWNGLAVGIAGGLLVGGGAALLLVDDEALAPLGIPLVAGGVTAALVGPPILLGGAMRANHSLRQRDVFASTASGVAGWTLLGAGMFIVPISVVAWPVGPAWYAGVLALGANQLEVNRRARAAAGLAPVRALTVALVPRPDGLLLAGTF